MTTTDISEKGLETLIIRHLTGTDWFALCRPVEPDESTDEMEVAGTAVK